MDLNQPPVENYANPKTCFFHVLFKAAALAFYILSALFFDNFVIIFVVTVLLAALDFWVVKNVSGRILVGLRWWNEINDLGESVWKFECLDQESLARINKKDSWLFWWTLYLSAIAWIVLGIFSLIRFQADYLLVVGVCLTLSIANIVGFTKCRKGSRPQAFEIKALMMKMQRSSFKHSLLRPLRLELHPLYSLHSVLCESHYRRWNKDEEMNSRDGCQRKWTWHCKNFVIF
ncbi:Golgi apparatus membrane protein-like protein ECHIDNA isoform X1 [Tripterygium wilfordii]|uniref:Golgi apparatus membrane protein-like protein ECHIDNA isoform X1 n=1 Tax=Tripterygium wilfordii TaxID=458696 RepID=UPI0018F7ED08|nr:Golgi apparatus membrane protein-like protein ECHIDNA isoform X1 [Tripterygium wilfordii]